MRVSTSCAHLGGDPDCLHDFLARGPVTEGRFRVPSDAVRALGDMRDCNGNKLLRLAGQRAIRKNPLAERLKRLLDLWGKLDTPGAVYADIIAGATEATAMAYKELTGQK